MTSFVPSTPREFASAQFFQAQKNKPTCASEIIPCQRLEKTKWAPPRVVISSTAVHRWCEERKETPSSPSNMRGTNQQPKPSKAMLALFTQQCKNHTMNSMTRRLRSARGSMEEKSSPVPRRNVQGYRHNIAWDARAKPSRLIKG